jgi:DNA-binding GntR family transcriptional regulator
VFIVYDIAMTSLDAQGPIARGEPLRESVYVRIVDLISSGHYPPGAALTEASLSRALDVSRTPVREALLRLEAEGVLHSALARGFTVRPLVRREVEELYPILASLEAHAVRAAIPVPKPTVDALRGTLAELERCQDPIRRWKLDTSWHGAIVAASGNGHLRGMITQLRTNISRYELAYMREITTRDEADHQHRDILAAVASREPDKAAKLLETHWHRGMQLVLEWLARTESQ